MQQQQPRRPKAVIGNLRIMEDNWVCKVCLDTGTLYLLEQKRVIGMDRWYFLAGPCVCQRAKITWGEAQPIVPMPHMESLKIWNVHQKCIYETVVMTKEHLNEDHKAFVESQPWDYQRIYDMAMDHTKEGFDESAFGS